MSDQISQRGTRVDHDSNAFVPADHDIKPLRDHILIEPLPWEPSKTIAVVATSLKPVRGRVLKVGPGRYPIKYDGPKGNRKKSWESKVFVKTEIKPGDIVELGGLEIGGYLFASFTWGNRKVVMCREADVTMVVQ